MPYPPERICNLSKGMLICRVSTAPDGVFEISPPAVDIHKPSTSLSLTKPMEVMRREVSRL